VTVNRSRARKIGGSHGRAVFAVEAIAAISILVLVTGALAQVSIAYMRAREHYSIERRLRLVAQAQMERYRAGVPLNAPPPEGVVSPDITLTTTVSPGTGAWAGMTRVTVTASAPGRRHRVHRAAVVGYLEEVHTP